MALTERQRSILLIVIREHIQTARAVGSETLVEHYHLDLSPASVRNAMVELEALGYLHQPHTSAGRVPTSKAYRLYIAESRDDAELSAQEQGAIREALHRAEWNREEQYKAVARAVAELCNNTVIVGFAQHDVYYTGLSYLFHQPEFSHIDVVRNLSEIVDRLDEVIGAIYDRVHDEPMILLGKESPFGEDTGTLMVKCGEDRLHSNLVGILGPLRMAYDQNVARLQFAKHVLT